MAAFHVRSISLPSRSHPLTVRIKQQLLSLKASHPSTIGQTLCGLKNLFECVDDSLQLPLNQQALYHEKQSNCAENALNGSVELLDICDITRIFFSQMMKSVQELELSLRRRKGRESTFISEVEAYMVSKKKLNKVIFKCLKNLRRKERKSKAASWENDSDSTSMISMLKEVEEISIAAFETILSFISQPMPKSEASGWFAVSKLLQSKHRSSGGEMEKIEKQLLVLNSSKDMKLEQVQHVAKGLKAMESSFQEVEEELECVYKQLVKTRVSLLNILNN